MLPGGLRDLLCGDLVRFTMTLAWPVAAKVEGGSCINFRLTVADTLSTFTISAT